MKAYFAYVKEEEFIHYGLAIIIMGGSTYV